MKKKLEAALGQLEGDERICKCPCSACKDICPGDKQLILIGDVLEAGEKLKDYVPHRKVLKLLELWRELGFTKSLQEIFEGAEWETGYVHNGVFTPSECTVELERLKDPAKKALAELLIGLFYNETQE